MNAIKKPELIAPAGSLEKLKLAYRMGADACYIGSSAFSMRTRQNKIALKEIEEAKEIAQSFGKKLYVCINIFPHNHLLKGLKKHLQFLNEIKPDAIVFADPSILEMVKDAGINIPLHLSVQNSTANHLSVKFWQRLGVKRIILARELSLKEIIEIGQEVPEVELEAFIHGSVCMAYSGRCFLSDIFSGRDANQGMCAHNCRDVHQVVAATVVNKTYGEQEMVIEEDEHGSHLISSKDICLLPHLDKLMKAGIDAFKIEGRNKSEYYLAVVTRVYREAIDSFARDGKINLELTKEIAKTNNRGFFSGFYFPDLGEQSEVLNDRDSDVRHYYAANIVSAEGSCISVKVKGKIKTGDSLRLLTAEYGGEQLLKVKGIVNQRKKNVTEISSGIDAVLELEKPAKKEWEGLVLQAT